MSRENGISGRKKIKLADSNPCVSCGACCAFFRVIFYWREAEGTHAEGAVPLKLTEDLDDFKRCMKGTAEKRGLRCISLQGKIGEQVGCGIYTNRPSPCRRFPASYVDGKRNKRCDEARLAHGLKPLRPEDWGQVPVRLPDQTEPLPPLSIDTT